MNGLERLVEANAIARLRERDASLFSDDIDARIPIVQRLGWTDLAQKAPGRLPLLDGLADALMTEGVRDILLLGMGGSSLAPLVMERIIGSSPGRPNLHVLDTTSPVQVTETLGRLDREHTFVIVASKSGTTIEPLTLYAIVRQWLEAGGMTRAEAGRQCLAITDQGTPLEKLRQRDLMRMTLSAPQTVGGRYSALSLFGLTPAALIGIDLPAVIARAQAMEAACAAPANENPGALLAAWMADAWAAGDDKLTLVFSERLRPFGLWVEQLVAESLGKGGVGIVPVIEYEPTTPTGYGGDRAIVVLRFEADAELAAWSREAASAHPVFELTVRDVFDIGGEFVRWEHAVALAGFLLDVNPFDEPNVTEAKQATTAILEGGATSVPAAQFDLDGTWVTFAGSLDVPSVGPTAIAEALRATIAAAGPEDYFALLAYVPEDSARFSTLSEATTRLARDTERAATLEFGPRYLHSTGQLHKGGPDTGVFVLITARDRANVAVPGKPYSLAALHRAQAEGDLVTLARHGRRVLRLDLPSSDASVLRALAVALAEAAERWSRGCSARQVLGSCERHSPPCHTPPVGTHGEAPAAPFRCSRRLQ